MLFLYPKDLKIEHGLDQQVHLSKLRFIFEDFQHLIFHDTQNEEWKHHSAEYF